MTIVQLFRLLQRFFISLSFFMCWLPVGYAQLTISSSHSAASLAAKIAGPGVTILSDTLICDTRANGTFVSTGTPLGLDSGILLTTGLAADASGAEPPLTSTALRFSGDPDLHTLIGGTTIDTDGCALIIHFIPKGDTISFRYQFGSEEYRQSTCGVYNDAFAFFITGPGISTTYPGINIAVIPGTTIPVAVNSVNSGTIGTTTGCNIANCTSMGSGSPFTTYYIDNTGGSSIAYRGYTDVFIAKHAVIPCDTYRIKMAIVDAGNDLYDSGVFIEGGSLTTNTYHFSRVDSIGHTINGIPHSIVKGCDPAVVKIVSDQPVSAAQVLTYTTGGTAVSGHDYVPISGTVTIPADSTSASFNVQGLVTTPTGTTTLELYLMSPLGCGIIDSFQLNIQDPPQADIISPDTTFCQGSSIHILVTGSPGLSYSWSPATGLDNPAIMEPTATPSITTTYYMTATLPGTGCPSTTDSIKLTKNTISISILTPDTTICPGASFRILVSGNDSFSYSWSPGTYLDSTNIKQPTTAPVSNIVYTVTAVAPGSCTITSEISVNIATFSVTITSRDTAICRGKVVQVLATGDTTGVTYQWIPTAGIAFSNILDPLIAPDTSAHYYLLGRVPGCTTILDSIFIDVQPNPSVYIGCNRFVCEYDTIHIHASVNPAWYSGYQYNWAPSSGLDNTNSPNVVFTAGATQKYILTVSTSAGCMSQDSAQIIVNPGNFASVSPSINLCPHDSAQLIATGADGGSYHWYPSLYLSDSLSAVPWVHPISSVNYKMIATSAQGCLDTLFLSVNVAPAAVILLPDSVTIFPGQIYQVEPQTNCMNFSWFPPDGLSNALQSNPVATPSISTKYIIAASTEAGCKAIDSINIIVDPNSLVAVPNAFTPGGSTNSLLKIILQGEATLNYFHIFNRWGNLVFDTKDITEGWDGGYKGKPQPQDVYIYELQVVTNTGSIINKHGNLTLLR